MEKILDELLTRKVEELWENSAIYGEEYADEVKKSVDIFHKLIALFKDNKEVYMLLMDLDAVSAEASSLKEIAMYKQGFKDGVKFLKNI